MGFSGNRLLGLQELTRGARSNTLRSATCSSFILFYETVASVILGEKGQKERKGAFASNTKREREREREREGKKEREREKEGDRERAREGDKEYLFLVLGFVEILVHLVHDLFKSLKLILLALYCISLFLNHH